MGEINNQIVFTDWDEMVKITDGGEEDPIPTFTYLKDIENNIKNEDYGVYFNPDKMAYGITDSGIDYEVILNEDERDNLLTGKKTPLLEKLNVLVSEFQVINSQRNLRASNIKKIQTMDSMVSLDGVDVEDLKLYLDYLKVHVLSNAKTKNEKKTIETRINKVSQIIKVKLEEGQKNVDNPEELNDYVYKRIREMLGLCRELSGENKERALNNVLKILDSYIAIDQKQRRKFTTVFVGCLDEVEKTVKDLIKKEKSELKERLEEFINGLENNKGGIGNGK